MADKCWKRSKSKSNLPKPIAFKPCCFLHAFAAWVLLKSSDQGWIGRERNLPGATGVAQKVGLAWLVASLHHLHPWSVQLNYVEPMYLIWWHIIHQTQMAKTLFVQLVILAGHDIHAFSWMMLICWEIYLIKSSWTASCPIAAYCCQVGTTVIGSIKALPRDISDTAE